MQYLTRFPGTVWIIAKSMQGITNKDKSNFCLIDGMKLWYNLMNCLHKCFMCKYLTDHEQNYSVVNCLRNIDDINPSTAFAFSQMSVS